MSHSPPRRQTLPAARKGRNARRRNLVAPSTDTGFRVQAALGGSPKRFLRQTFLLGKPTFANNYSVGVRSCVIPGSYYWVDTDPLGDTDRPVSSEASAPPRWQDMMQGGGGGEDQIQRGGKKMYDFDHPQSSVQVSCSMGNGKHTLAVVRSQSLAAMAAKSAAKADKSGRPGTAGTCGLRQRSASHGHLRLQLTPLDIPDMSNPAQRAYSSVGVKGCISPGLIRKYAQQ
eukprot:gnl/MRDRNA2_/MRDRNA2_105455_c0_seq1.p1 gnl/MRDRNA2_/MRDRNA2_105455_c0~~gnl/MRDRNA2_/MRDRNA2_105455_c0_seq1.p1  ORF type:complete len:229 (-),score=35.75 gnl/MRDRNA2_/MRDRNA2_105455_c0_seq1:227-913(-)